MGTRGACMRRTEWARRLGVCVVLLAAGVAAAPAAETEEEAENLFRSSGFEDTGLCVQREQHSHWVKFKHGGLSAGVSCKLPGLDVSLDNASDFIAGKVSLRVDASKLPLSKGERERPLVRFYALDHGSIVPGREYTIAVWVKADRNECQATLFFEGKVDGRHFWKANSITVNTAWKEYAFTQRMPEKIETMHVRFDCLNPAVYWFDDQAFRRAEEEAAAVDGRNWIVNGSAERGWYSMGQASYKNRLTVKGVFMNWKRERVTPDSYMSWSIDETEARVGRRSFKGVLKANKGWGGRISFNPVPFEVGKPYCFSVYLKADRRTVANLGLYVCSGIAYAKSVSISPEWRRFSLVIPEWGKAFKGSSRIGDVSAGYGCPLGLVTPHVGLRDGGAIWVDGAQYVAGEDREFEDPSTLWLRGSIDKDKAYYYTGEEVKARFEIENVLKDSRSLEVRYAIRDYFGAEVSRTAPERIELAGGKTAAREYVIRPEIKGAFNLCLFVKDPRTDEQYDHNLYLGVIDPPGEPRPQFGLDIGTFQNVKELVPYLEDFGIGSVRVWSDYRKALGRHAGFDNLAALKEAGLYVLFNLDLLPTSPKWYVAPKDPTEWKRFLTGVIAKHRGLVDCYEVLNEPNIWGGRGENPDPEKYDFMSPEVYVRVLKAAHAAIRKADPKALVGGPTTCHTDIVWTANVLAGGGKDSLDVVTEHPYRQKPEAPDYEKDLKSLRAVIEREGKSFPIFASEAGQLTNALLPANLISKKMRRSAALSIRIQIIGFANGLNKYFHFHSKLWPEGTGWQTFFLGNPGNHGECLPNPYLFAIRNLADRIGGARPLGRVKLGTAVRCYVFEKDEKDRRVAALWKCEDEGAPSAISLGLAGDFDAYDIVGNAMDPVLKDGRCRFPLRGSPMYVETSMTLAELELVFASAFITGIGKPFSTSVSVADPATFAVEVQNRHHWPLSGTVTILNAETVKGEATKAFQDVPSGARSKVVFTAARPIGTAPQALKVRTVLADGKTFAVDEFMLKAMLCKKARTPVVVDGKLADWGDASVTTLTFANAYRTREGLWKPKDERIQAHLRTAWDDGWLYVAVTVEKPVFFQDAVDASAMWRGDGIQVAFDTLKDGDPDVRSYGDDDFEYSVGLVRETPLVYRHCASSVTHDGFQKTKGLLKGEVRTAIRKGNGKVVYEMAFPPQAVSPFRLRAGNSMRWNIIVNLNNGQGRMGWLELTPGIGQTPKSPGEFMELVLVE